MIISFTGCNSLDRLINGRDSNDSPAAPTAPNPPAPQAPLFYVYQDHNSTENHFTLSHITPGNDAQGRNDGITFDTASRPDESGAGSAIAIEYKMDNLYNLVYSGIFWQDLTQGFNLSPQTKLVFKARGELGGEIIDRFAIGGYHSDDSTHWTNGPITLSNNWKTYTFDLTGVDLSNIITGFYFRLSRYDNPNGAKFYLDEIRFE